MVHANRGIFVLVIIETLAIGWVLRDRQSVLPSIALALVVFLIWSCETTGLYFIATGIQQMHPKIKRHRLMMTYGGFWGIQVVGALLLYSVMQVHTLPIAFELVVCHLFANVIVYCVRKLVEPFLVRSNATKVNDCVWWDSAASAAGISPVCCLFSILICKACSLF